MVLYTLRESDIGFEPTATTIRKMIKPCFSIIYLCGNSFQGIDFVIVLNSLLPHHDSKSNGSKSCR